MCQITKEIQLTIDGNPVTFRLTKPDAFSGVTPNHQQTSGNGDWFI